MKRAGIATVVMLCAVMTLVAAAPLAFADSHHIVKGAQGPRASAMTWTFEAPDYGMWYGHIVNNGLRSVVVDVADVSTGVPVEASHERIRFAASGVFPTGELDTARTTMASGRMYEITITPNGPKDSFCDIEDMFIPVISPVAAFSIAVNSMTVSVDASASLDPDGTIVSYAWTFGDGGAASGVTASHTYASMGTFDISLTVKDNDALPATLTKSVVIFDAPPVAMFTSSALGFVLSVDASSSTDDFGIVSYTWNWGDGTSSTGVVATHDYGAAAAPASVAAQSMVRQPVPPYNIQGMTLDQNGNAVGNSQVVITNVRTGESVTVMSDPIYGWYEYDLNLLTLGFVDGDTISVVATAPGYSGSAQAIVVSTNAYIDLNVLMMPTEMQITVTLTVADALGQTSTMTQVLTLVPA